MLGTAFYQGLLHETNGKLSLSLQQKSAFSLLGYCSANDGSNGLLSSARMEEDGEIESSPCGNADELCGKDIFTKNRGQWTCGCRKLDGLLEKYRQLSVGNCRWIQLVCDFPQQLGVDVSWIPRLHHFHWDGQIVSQCDVHVCKLRIFMMHVCF